MADLGEAVNLFGVNMRTQIDVAKHRLFDEGALNADNVKLFPGSRRDASREEMAEQVNKALSQIEAGDFELVVDFDD
ncbi:MAG: hypothetical protein HQL36_01305 [Alphaproteobacteria bacterium]|nr:hypothetical protein [Alphaproteobacteria bacterium]